MAFSCRYDIGNVKSCKQLKTYSISTLNFHVLYMWKVPSSTWSDTWMHNPSHCSYFESRYIFVAEVSNIATAEMTAFNCSWILLTNQSIQLKVMVITCLDLCVYIYIHNINSFCYIKLNTYYFENLVFLHAFHVLVLKTNICFAHFVLWVWR